MLNGFNEAKGAVPQLVMLLDELIEACLETLMHVLSVDMRTIVAVLGRLGRGTIRAQGLPLLRSHGRNVALVPINEPEVHAFWEALSCLSSVDCLQPPGLPCSTGRRYWGDMYLVFVKHPM